MSTQIQPSVSNQFIGDFPHSNFNEKLNDLMFLYGFTKHTDLYGGVFQNWYDYFTKGNLIVINECDSVLGNPYYVILEGSYEDYDNGYKLPILLRSKNLNDVENFINNK